jgi:hypothetical protein
MTSTVPTRAHLNPYLADFFSARHLGSLFRSGTGSLTQPCSESTANCLSFGIPYSSTLDVIVSTWSSQARTEAKRFRGWVFGRLDTLTALIGGGIAAAFAAKGSLTGHDLAAATLSLLALVAFSMVVERSLRLKASMGIEKIRTDIEEVRDDIQKTREALRVLESGSPYHVTISESTWDLNHDGGVSLLRRKHLRIAQDDVVTVLDWLKADGEVVENKYRPLPGKPVHTYDSDGRQHVLVALDRPRMRDEELDFFIERKVERAFVGNPEQVLIVAYESTSLVRMTVRWPATRPPTEVRFYRRSDAERRKPVVLRTTKTDDGREQVEIDAQNPSLGERICIEWDWEPPTPGETHTPNGIATATTVTEQQPDMIGERPDPS